MPADRSDFEMTDPQDFDEKFNEYHAAIEERLEEGDINEHEATSEHEALERLRADMDASVRDKDD